jgi:hypothetical protein
MIGFLISVIIKINGMNFQPSSVVRTSIIKLCFYPIIFIGCWLFSCIEQFTVTSTSGSGSGNFIMTLISLLSVILPILQGFFNSIAFFYLNDIVKNRWYKFYCELFNIDSKNTSRGDSIIRQVSVCDEESYIDHNEGNTDDNSSSRSSSFMNIIHRFSSNYSQGSSISSSYDANNIEFIDKNNNNIKGIISFNNPIVSSSGSNFNNNLNVSR